MQEIILSAEGKDIQVTVDGRGFFVHRVRDMVSIMKDYTVKNANKLLEDFNGVIQGAMDALMVQFEAVYIKHFDPLRANETQVLIDFGLIPAGEAGNIQFSPIIYENYLALQSYGDVHVVKSGESDTHHQSVSDNFLPLYMNTDQNSQVFLSQATFNQLLYLVKSRNDTSYLNDTYFGIPCTVAALKGYIVNLDAHPISKTCKFKVYLQEDYTLDRYDSLNATEISFQAGDIYAENTTMTIELLFQDVDYLFQERVAALNITLNSTIFHF